MNEYANLMYGKLTLPPMPKTDETPMSAPTTEEGTHWCRQ